MHISICIPMKQKDPPPDIGGAPAALRAQHNPPKRTANAMPRPGIEPGTFRSSV